jgi:hypothetical protein
MKKKLLSAICAAALCLAMPAMAFAQDSPSQATPTYNTVNGIETTITFDDPAGTVAASDKVAAGYNNDADDSISFTLTGEQGGTLTLNVSTKYAGYTAVLYIEHNDGTTETQTSTVAANGTVTFTIDKFSTYTLALYAPTGTAASTATDTSATSPKTGFDMSELVLISGGLVVAAGATFAARKKIAA